MFKNRSAIEIMVISFTFILSALVLMLGITTAIIKIFNPAQDVSTAVTTLSSIMSAILAALLGLIAGKNENLSSVQMRPKREEDVDEFDEKP